MSIISFPAPPPYQEVAPGTDDTSTVPSAPGAPSVPWGDTPLLPPPPLSIPIEAPGVVEPTETCETTLPVADMPLLPPIGLGPEKNQKTVSKMYYLIFSEALPVQLTQTQTATAMLIVPGSEEGFRTKDAFNKFTRGCRAGNYSRVTIDTKAIEIIQTTEVKGL